MTMEEDIIDIGDTGSIIDSPPSISVDTNSTSPLSQTDPTNEQAQHNNSWTDNTYTDMDSDSRALIEQMLAEEEFYYGQNTMATMKRQKKSESATKKKTMAKKRKVGSGGDYEGEKVTSLSSASLPSHKTRWSSEEDSRLTLALEKYGYGNWKPIAEFVNTRNPLQCKNRARHWAVYGKNDIPATTLSASPSTHIPLEIHQADTDKADRTESSLTTLTEKTINTTTDKRKTTPSIDGNDNNSNADDDDENISVEDDDSPAPSVAKLEPEDKEQQIQQIVDENLTTNDGTTTRAKISGVVNDNSYGFANENHEMDTANSNDIKEPSTSMTKPQDSTSTSMTEISPTQRDDHGVSRTSEAKISTIPLNNQENDDVINSFDPYTISEEEKRSNPEWFNNKQSKTPDRYLKIRNHMLKCWRSCRPKYLTKTGSRKALKDCGDVNAIGRVHSYLENLGAINVNCVNSAPRGPRGNSTSNNTSWAGIDDDEEDYPSSIYAASDLIIGYDGPRKRKVRNELGDWVDPKELEGRVIEHDQHQPIVQARSKRIIKRSQHYYGGDDFGRGYDPFRLIPVEYYDDHYPAPFIVQIASNSLLVMDFHSHLAHTEIIGLLGGTYETDSNGGKQLVVKSVFPCKSTSTGIQCEMDPESEMKARDVFAANGYIVVGWYHSHPTFEPHPSIRDIENQTSYQTLFRHEKTGDEPFIGVIVTPYDLSVASDQSQIQYLHISNQWNENHSFRVPYACRKSVNHDEDVPSVVLDQMKELVDEFKDYEHKINMLSTYGTQSRLDKLIDSLRSNLFMDLGRADTFLQFVRSLILKEFVDEEDERLKEAGENDALPTAPPQLPLDEPTSWAPANTPSSSSS